ncbi:hypothetical protein [Salimicrobium flavidum]|uniref:Uncharacterized protein n=1 Tax=Salimicrobium flavidum TaxID=570947 RepID=A0A1N7IWS0_9BACI|nr:hypothetical protein [Salimicrobium flavidum]SIS41535.1 hypothetical protein SAMN05421687_102378 [Salimicrobium flavidum]
MTEVVEQNPLEDERVRLILDSMSEGKTRDQLAEQLNHKNYKTLDIYMRRKGFTWDKQDMTYKLKVDEDTTPPSIDRTKAGKVVMLLNDEEHNVRTVAQKLRFPDHLEMANYMKGQGYEWSEDQENYIKRIGKVEHPAEDIKFSEDERTKNVGVDAPVLEQSTMDRYASLLHFLEQNEDQLVELLSTNPSSAKLPRYTLPGAAATKTVQMMSSLKEVVSAYSQEYNISQREVFEVALIEFFEKYGYSHQVDVLLKR